MKNKIFLGIDVGTKHIGCAINTISNNVSSIKILNVIKIRKNNIEYVKINKIIEHWKPEAIVLGIPYNNQFTFFFIKKISKIISIRYNIKIFFICENFTSWEAKKLYLKNKERTNSYSAMIILKSFLINNFFL